MSQTSHPDQEPPRLELLYWDGCPSYPAALAQLRGLLHELGCDHIPIAPKHISTLQEARDERFVGSPTFRFNDTDLIPSSPTDDFDLTCRVYQLRNGNFSPTPDPVLLRKALTAALGLDSTVSE
jgi:hypothetical protein